MKKNVFRNFDFVIRQTDEMKEIQKIASKRIFFPVFNIYRDLSWDYSSNEISTFEKKSLISQK